MSESVSRGRCQSVNRRLNLRPCMFVSFCDAFWQSLSRGSSIRDHPKRVIKFRLKNRPCSDGHRVAHWKLSFQVTWFSWKLWKCIIAFLFDMQCKYNDIWGAHALFEIKFEIIDRHHSSNWLYEIIWNCLECKLSSPKVIQPHFVLPSQENFHV